MKVLIVVAHTDDEVIGCAGTIARHVAAGDTVNIVYMADGVTSRDGYQNEELLLREKAATKAQAILGCSNVFNLGFPDNKMDTLSILDVVKPLEEIIQEFNPESIYTHHYGDLNVDHRVTHQAVMTACRPLPSSSVKQIYTFEVMSSTEWASPGNLPFLKNYFVDISAFMDIKQEALNAYALEMRKAPHSRSIENIMYLARHNGHCVGVDAAEAFMLMRYII